VSWLGCERTHLEVCGSTSDEAATRARQGAPHGAVITAGAQTAGRGRAGRVWSSDGANLYASIVLRPTISPAEAPGVTLAAGIGVCDAVRIAVGAARLKWPNDVLVGDRKIAGVLTEMTTRRDAIDAIILGIGVNVNGADLALATSLRQETGVAHEVGVFAELLLATLEPWLDRFFAGGVAAIAEDWTARADLGRRVQIPAGAGTPRGLDRDGALVVALDTGGEARVVAGDVVEI